MLFRKKMPRSCLYCAHATKLDGDQLLCSKQGIVDADDACRKFKYDPLKRVPARPKALDLSKYDEEDFSL